MGVRRSDSLAGAARAMASQFPNVAHFRTIEGAELFVHEEQPAAVAAWLFEFLTTLAAH